MILVFVRKNDCNLTHIFKINVEPQPIMGNDGTLGMVP